MASQSNEPLPDGYRLNNYTIEKLLSSGGFSIVYLGRDESGSPVAIKEYLPAALWVVAQQKQNEPQSRNRRDGNQYPTAPRRRLREVTVLDPSLPLRRLHGSVLV